MKDEALKLALEAYCKTLHPLWNTRISRTEAEGFFEAGFKAATAEAHKQVAFKIYKPTPPRGAIPDVRDAELPWVYDQDQSSGNVASMWVTPVKSTPPAAQRQWVGLTDEEVIKCTPTWGGTVEDVARAIEAKLKEKNT